MNFQLEEGGNIFQEMEDHTHDTKQKFLDHVDKLHSYVEIYNELLWMFKDILQRLIDEQKREEILNNLPQGCNIDARLLMVELYEAGFKTKTESKKQTWTRETTGGDTMYARTLYVEEVEVEDPESDEVTDIITYIYNQLFDFKCDNLTLEDIVKLPSKLKRSKMVMKYINDLRFTIFKDYLSKYLALPLVNIIKRF